MSKKKRLNALNIRREISSEFQMRVPLAVNNIPRGKVASYRMVAEIACRGEVIKKFSL